MHQSIQLKFLKNQIEQEISGVYFFFFRFFGKDYTTNQVEVFRHVKNHMLGPPVENEAEVRLLCLQRNFKLERSLAGIYLLKVNTRNSRTRCEICSKFTIKTP